LFLSTFLSADDILFNLNPTVSFELLILDRGNQER
jgi:hypothetical protein